MAVELKMPKLGMTMEVGNLVEWNKKEKDNVEKKEILFVVETDKVTYEVESPDAGILVVLVQSGNDIPVGTVVGYLAETEEEYNHIKSGSSAPVVAEAASDAVLAASDEAVAEAEGPAFAARTRKVRATPGARKMAKQKGIDIKTVTGTGPQGRITRDDVLQALKIIPVEETPAAALEEVPELVKAKAKRLLREEPMTGMRAMISRRMMESLMTTAQMTAHSEWDLTELMKLRRIMNRSQDRLGYKVTIPGLMLFFLAKVLKEMPIFNASIEGNTFKYWQDVNIGVAVAVSDGLVVPVVHGSDRKSLREIQETLADLIERARSKKLMPDDMTGGTFTLSNLGSYGGEWETVILNPPEVALLGIGNIAKKPVVIDDEIVIRQVMPISLTFDHSIIDGAVAGEFRNRMKELVENPGLSIA